MNGGFSRLLSLGRLGIKPGGSAKLRATPLSGGRFAPTKLIVPDDVARHFLVTGFHVAFDSQFLSNAAVPAELFAEHGPCFDLLMSELLPDQEVVLVVQSASDVSQDFRCFLGPSDVLAKKVVLGYGSVAIEPGSCANINVEPFRAFRPSHLFLPSTVAPHFLINEVWLSTYGTKPDDTLVCVKGSESNEQGRAGESDLTEIERYDLGGRLVSLHLSPTEVVQRRQFLTISVTNTDSVQRSFTAAVVGDPCE